MNGTDRPCKRAPERRWCDGKPGGSLRAETIGFFRHRSLSRAGCTGYGRAGYIVCEPETPRLLLPWGCLSASDSQRPRQCDDAVTCVLARKGGAGVPKRGRAARLLSACLSHQLCPPPPPPALSSPHGHPSVKATAQFHRNGPVEVLGGWRMPRARRWSHGT